jgi:uncharacterized glyoxalase superfamily protein PhnB
MKVLKVTPILVVERIEAVLDVWEKALGFSRVAAVPETGELVFVLLVRDGMEVMLQTRSGLAANVRPLDPSSVLYMDVDSIDLALSSLEKVEILEEPHGTFYGTREVTVRDPSGQILTFAEHVPVARG